MKQTKACVAMILAGGAGNRLSPLTHSLAKPAVPFGGKYRIIDFTLSNCVHSGIDTVGVLTQYQPLVLSDYIGSGDAWDLDLPDCGVHILPPYQARRGGAWYRGTANAVWQNRAFSARYGPRLVLILSGDHIYRMDYAALLAYHTACGADCTVAAVEVAPRDASRFGILSTDRAERVTDFIEKPTHPAGNLASMGIYVFDPDYLWRVLAADDADATSQKDFGKNVLPAILRSGGRLFAYRFSGYWRDVGTLESLWQANMDLLGDDPAFDLFGGQTRVLSRPVPGPPQFAAAGAVVRRSILTAGCRVAGRVERSVLSPDVVVEAGAVVRDSVLMRGVHVAAGARVEYAILDEGVQVGRGEVCGTPREAGGTLTTVGREVNA